MPVRSPGHAFALGTLWGWLPCGLVYSVLIWSISAGDALRGALLMLAFGLGTLPNLLAMGVAAARLNAFTRLPAVRIAAGAAVMGFGVWSVWTALGG
jgi:sulfite exporter TauE/SafE